MATNLANVTMVRHDATQVRCNWSLTPAGADRYSFTQVHWYVQWNDREDFTYQSSEQVSLQGSGVYESIFTVPETAVAAKIHLAVVHNNWEWHDTPAFFDYWGNPRDQKPPTVEAPTVSIAQYGSTESVRATWTWGRQSETDSYRVVWQELVGGSWDDRSSTTVDAEDTLSAIYNPTDDAVYVRAKVTTIATSEKWSATPGFSPQIVNPSVTAAEQVKLGEPTAPSAPSVSQSGTSFEVTWTYSGWPSDTYSSYRMELWRSANGGTYQKVATLPYSSSNSYRYTDSSTAVGTTYRYRVRAVNAYNGTRHKDGVESSLVMREPKAPANASAIAMDADAEGASAAIRLTWSQGGPAATFTGFEVQWTDDGDFSSSGAQSANVDDEFRSYKAEGLQANVQYSFRVRATGTGGQSAWSNVVRITPRVRPMTPSCEAEYSNGAVKVTVTSNDTAANYVRIWRRTTSGAWGVIAKLAHKSSVTYVDNGTTAGYRYLYAATAVISDDLESDMSAYDEVDGWVEREPAAPTDFSAVAVSVSGESGTARLTWANQAETGDGYEIRYSSNAEVDLLETASGAYQETTVSGTAASCTIGGLDPAETWRFAMRRTNGAGSSEWATTPSGGNIAQTVIATTPEAPTVTSTRLAYAMGDTIPFEWSHNDEDGSEQQGAEVQLSVEGGTATTISVSGSQNYHDWTATGDSGDTVTWRVRTLGLGEDNWSPWSETRSFRIWAAPTCSLSLMDASGDIEGQALTALPLRATVEATVDGTGENDVIEWWLEVVSIDGYETTAADGSVLKVAPGSVTWSRTDTASSSDWSQTDGSAHGFSIGAADMRFMGGYLVRAGLLTAQGLASESDTIWVECMFSESSVGEPTAELTVDSTDYTCAISCESRDSEGALAPCTLSVYRIEAGGDAILVESGLENDGTAQCSDPHPNFGKCTYRVIATHSATGAQAFTEVVADVPVPGILIQWDGGSLTLPYNLELDESYAPDVVLRGYEGRKDPVSYFGTQRGRTASWKAEVSKREHTAEVAAARELAGHMAPCYVRDPAGNGYDAVITSMKIGRSNMSGAVSISLEVSRVVS